MKLLILLAWHYERLVRCGLSFGRLHPRSPDPVGACDGLRKLDLKSSLKRQVHTQILCGELSHMESFQKAQLNDFSRR